MKMITSALITLIAAAAFANDPHAAPAAGTTAPATHEATATTPDGKVATADMEAKCKNAPKTDKECATWMKKNKTKK